FFTFPATPEFYNLSLHDALPIWCVSALPLSSGVMSIWAGFLDGSSLNLATMSLSLPLTWMVIFPSLMMNAVTSAAFGSGLPPRRSEEHTSELQSQSNLVCRLLLE